jgi:hypothetical protein
VPFGLDSAGDSALGRVIVGDRWFPKTLRGLKAAEALEPTPRLPEVADSTREPERAPDSASPPLSGEERPASWRRPSYDLQLETLARLSDATDDENTPSSAPAERAPSEEEPPPSGAPEPPRADGQRARPARFARAGSTAPGPRTAAARSARGRFRRFARGPVPNLLAGFALGMVTMLGVDRARARLGHTPARLASNAPLASHSALAGAQIGLPSPLAQGGPATPASSSGEHALATLPAASSASSARAQPSRAKADRAALFAFAHEQQRRLRLEDAQRIYEGVLRVRPADAEALCGLAELALLRGDSNRAEALYERALQLHGDYAPAWLGSADIAWQRGDQARAARLYQTVTARFPEGAYPPYAEQRAQEPTAQADAPQARPRCDK